MRRVKESNEMTGDAGKIDQFHQHEVLHTAQIISSMFEDYIVTHRCTQSDPEILEAAEKISAALADFYQLVGQKNLEDGTAN
jgi:hypothetical protein